MIRPLTLLPAVLAAAAAFTVAPALARPREIPAATPTGPAVDCVPINQIRESRVRDDSTIDFVMSGGRRVYRVVLPNSCPSLGFERAFSYATSLSQLCSTDIITVFHQGGGPHRGASCGMGSFTPVTLADRAH